MITRLRSYSLTILIPALLGACRQSSSTEKTEAIPPKHDDQVIMALLYQQRAAEYHALCLQCYNLARFRVDQAIQDTRRYTAKPFAVVTDLDETALDNSENEAWLYQHDSTYQPNEFNDWSTYGHARAVPGSVAFFNYINSIKDKKGRKIAIYYISNRTNTPAIVDSTISQMGYLHFPQLTESQFLFKDKDSTSSKEGRRAQVSQHHDIIVLLGDNLIDLSATFDSTVTHPEERIKRVDSLTTAWGAKYIVFPNAEYGDWEQALYPNGKYTNLSVEQKDRVSDLTSSHYTK